MIKTTEYFKKTVDELIFVVNEQGYTREECKIFDDGIKVSFFDTIEEYEQEKEELNRWVKEWDSRLELKVELLTVNERIAVIYA